MGRMRINLQQNYFNKDEKAQNTFLKAVLKQCEQNDVDDDGQLFDSLHLHHFFSREMELDANQCSATKNNLIARILQDLTVPKHTPAILVSLPGFFNRIIHIYTQAKCNGQSCDARCSRTCTLGILSNVALADGLADKVDEAFKQHGFYSVLLNWEKMCKLSQPNAITLIDTLSQRMDVAQKEILLRVEDTWFDMLLKQLKKAGASSKKELSEFKQSVQSIMVNLAKWDVEKRFLLYNDFAVARVMVEEIERKTEYVRNALIVLHNFALHDTKEVLRLCLPVLDSHLLRLAVLAQTDYTVQLNAIRLLAVFFGKRELLKPDMAWLRKLHSGVRSGNSEVAMWSIVCLALLDDETLPMDIGYTVLEELVDYLRMSNAEEDFPIDLLLTCIYKLLMQARKYVETMNRLNLFEQLWACLEITWGNEHSVAFGKALECAAICTEETQEQLLVKFCSKFVDEENADEVALFNKFLARYTTEFELEFKTGKLIVHESEAVRRFAAKLNKATPNGSAISTYENAPPPKRAKQDNEPMIKKKSKVVVVVDDEEEEEQRPVPKKWSTVVVDDEKEEEEKPKAKRRPKIVVDGDDKEEKVETTKKKWAAEPAAAAKAPVMPAQQQQPAYVPSVFDFLPPPSSSNNGGNETEDDEDLLRDIAEVPVFGDEMTLPANQHQLQQQEQQQREQVEDERRKEEERLKQQPVTAIPAIVVPKENAVTAENESQTDADALLQLGLISQQDHQVFCTNLLTIDVLKRMSSQDTEAFVPELRAIGLSSLSAKRLLVHFNPAVCGNKHRNMDPEDLVNLLLNQKRITAAETCHILNNRISLSVLRLMDDADYDQAEIRVLLKNRLRVWAGTL